MNEAIWVGKVGDFGSRVPTKAAKVRKVRTRGSLVSGSPLSSARKAVATCSGCVVASFANASEVGVTGILSVRSRAAGSLRSDDAVTKLGVSRAPGGGAGTMRGPRTGTGAPGNGAAGLSTAPRSAIGK